jgi:hypothetical protein
MRTKCALVLVSAAALALQLGSAGAAPNPETRPRWEEAVEPQAAKIILHNLSAQPAEAALGSATVAIPAAGVAEIPALPAKAGALSLRSDAALLVVQAPDEFDAKSLEIDQTAPRPATLAPGKLLLRPAPEWTRELATGGASVRHGATGWATVASDDGTARVEVAVAFLAPHTRVRIRQLDSFGNEVTSLVASASRPVRWRATLAPVDGTSRIEMRTLRGEAQGTATATGSPAGSRARRPRPILQTKSGGGLGIYSPEINWDGNPSTTYSVSGGPANLCGDLYVSRNGAAYTFSPGWICLDASGNATKGPWYQYNQTADETAFVYIVWSNGWSTNTTEHIWDVYGPSAAITSPNGPPAPTSFSGTASDPIYGAGFSSSWNSRCITYFQDTTTGYGYYWDPTYGYNNYYPYYSPYCTLSGMPSHSVTWSEGQIPPGYAHFSHHCYEWGAYIIESPSSSKYSWTHINFCIP